MFCWTKIPPYVLNEGFYQLCLVLDTPRTAMDLRTQRQSVGFQADGSYRLFCSRLGVIHKLLDFCHAYLKVQYRLYKSPFYRIFRDGKWQIPNLEKPNMKFCVSLNRFTHTHGGHKVVHCSYGLLNKNPWRIGWVFIFFFKFCIGWGTYCTLK